MSTTTDSRTSTWKNTASAVWSVGFFVAIWLVTIGVISRLMPDKPVIATLIANAIVIVIFYLYHTRRRRSNEEKRIRTQNIGTDVIAVILASTLCWWVSVQVFVTIVNNSLNSKGFDNFNKAISEAPLIAVLALTLIAAPIAEELVLRGAVYHKLTTALSIPVATIISAIMFGAVHGNAIQMIGTIPLGITLAMVYEVTRRLRMSIITHMFFNATSIIMPMSVIASVTTHSGIAWLVIAIAAVGGIAGWVFLAAKMSTVRQRYLTVNTTDNAGQATISPETPDEGQ